MENHLKIKLTNGLELDDPFIIASSHLTDSVNAFEFLSKAKPAAVTTKTISIKYGGNKNSAKKSRTLKRLSSWRDNYVGLYADGPKEKELWGLEISNELLKDAKNILPDAKLGISVLQGEDYLSIKNGLDVKYDYVELNLKYSLRLSEEKKLKLSKVMKELKKDILSFCTVFDEYPKLIKLSREAFYFLKEIFTSSINEILLEHKVAVIIANSKKLDGPPSYTRFVNASKLENGVIVGDYLFLETYNMIKDFSGMYKEIEIVGNGGIMSIGEVLDCLSLGVTTFQICTLIHRDGKAALDNLRGQLNYCMQELKVQNLQELSIYLQTNQENKISKILNDYELA